MKSLSGPMHIEDLIDLEYFLTLDESDTSDARSDNLHKRDRTLFLERISPELGGTEMIRPEERKSVIRRWLDERRREWDTSPDGFRPLPGRIYRQIYTVLRLVFAATGFLSGTGLCFSFLMYRGHDPLNVSSYLGIFVLTQIALIVLIIILFIITKTASAKRDVSLIRMTLSHLIVKLALWIKTKSLNRISTEKRYHFESALGILKGKSRTYGAIFPWPVFILTQVFAIGFNIGVLGATLLKVAGSDLAFGWQSTLQLSDAAVFRAVQILSAPWSAIIPETMAHPSLAQIEGTRIILKDGIARLATPDLVSWWPFLCFCILFYGLIPRLFLFILASVMKAASLRSVSLETSAFDRLVFRMGHPLLETRGYTGETVTVSRVIGAPLPTPSQDAPVGKTALVLVPDEIADACTDDDLHDVIHRQAGMPVREKIPVTLDISSDSPSLSRRLANTEGEALVIIMEAWQAPIRETVSYIRDVRNLGCRELRATVLLVGKPRSGEVLTPPDEMDIALWRQKINGLADPFISVDWIRNPKAVTGEQEAVHG